VARPVYLDRAWPNGSLLGRLSPANREALLTLGAPIEYKSPKLLIREGSHDDTVYILLSGVTKVTGRAENGRESLLAIRASGEIIGELAAVDGQPRSATVTTCGRAGVASIKSSEFQAFLRRNPDTNMAVNREIAQKLRDATRHRIDVGCNPVKLRIAHVLDELATRYGKPDGQEIVIDVALTQHEIGQLVGAADTTVQKELRRMRTAGLIKTGYNLIIVRDLPGLRDMTGLISANPYFY
jgi:CRP-like cAMP-binding protein